MPSGVEVVYGVRGAENINAFLVESRIEVIDWKNDGPREWKEQFSGPSLYGAHEACLREFFEVKPQKRSNFILAHTPKGLREFSVFSLELYYDPDEMDDTPETALLGVGLSGRYFPSYLDWQSPHGCIEWVKLDPHTMQMIEKAKQEICKVLPAAEAAFTVQFMEVWY